MSSLTRSRGFSMIEMMIVILILGISAAFVVPGVVSMTQGTQLNAAASGLAGRLQLARSKAMSTGQNQTICFSADSLGTDYHTHASGGGMADSWKFPRGIVYSPSSYQSVTMLSNGRAASSTFIVLSDRRGILDTVSVQTSGLVVVYR